MVLKDSDLEIFFFQLISAKLYSICSHKNSTKILKRCNLFRQFPHFFPTKRKYDIMSLRQEVKVKGLKLITWFTCIDEVISILGGN